MPSARARQSRAPPRALVVTGLGRAAAHTLDAQEQLGSRVRKEHLHTGRKDVVYNGTDRKQSRTNLIKGRSD